MERTTSVARAVVQGKDDIAADAAAKKFLSHTAILGYILRNCCREFSGCSPNYIAEKCTLSDMRIEAVPVDPDEDEDNAEGQLLDGNRKALTEAEESSEKNAPTLRFDILFRVETLNRVKRRRRYIRVNLEIQKRDTPGYSIVSRAIYYCARLISKQGEGKTAKELYRNVDKVYSIWICPVVAQERQNTITRYRIKEEGVSDQPIVQEKLKRYDLAEVVVVRLGKGTDKTGNELLDLLNLVFGQSPAEEKLQKMREEYNITTEEMEEEVRTMSTLFQKVIADATPDIIEKAAPDIIKKNRLETLRNLMRNLRLTPEQAMDAVEIPSEDRPYFASMLAQ